jgi:hypothetical protein
MTTQILLTQRYLVTSFMFILNTIAPDTFAYEENNQKYVAK